MQRRGRRRRGTGDGARLEPVSERVSLEVEGGFGRPPWSATPRNRALWEAARKRRRASSGSSWSEASVGGASDGNVTSAFTATLDGLGPSATGRTPPTSTCWSSAMPERAALLGAALAEPGGAVVEAGATATVPGSVTRHGRLRASGRRPWSPPARAVGHWRLRGLTRCSIPARTPTASRPRAGPTARSSPATCSSVRWGGAPPPWRRWATGARSRRTSIMHALTARLRAGALHLRRSPLLPDGRGALPGPRRPGRRGAAPWRLSSPLPSASSRCRWC